MATTNLSKLAALVEEKHENLLSKWRGQVRALPSARHLDIPTLNDHIPHLLRELSVAFKISSSQTIADSLAEESAIVHGLQRLKDGFDIEEVVAEYNILRGCIHDLAHDHGFELQGKPFHIINRVFDQAIGLALKTYATERAAEVQQRREDYLAFVAHDLHTPLFAISLAGRALERHLPTRGYCEDSVLMLQTLRRGIQQLEGLVQQVLEENTHLQNENGLKLVRREFDLWPMVEALLEDLDGIATAAGTRLINEVPIDLTVYADASLLRRIFQNLIANAIKYAPRGKVRISASELAGGEAIECRVSDDGAGIPVELLDRVFEKGATDSADGNGLGLAIVQTFTEAHGGSASVESEPGAGATFRLTLPVKPR